MSFGSTVTRVTEVSGFWTVAVDGKEIIWSHLFLRFALFILLREAGKEDHAKHGGRGLGSVAGP